MDDTENREEEQKNKSTMGKLRHMMQRWCCECREEVRVAVEGKKTNKW